MKTCAVCKVQGSTDSPITDVRIERRTIALCAKHRQDATHAHPASFEELRAAFAAGDDRRSPLERRMTDDRRDFPPRLEGRRKSDGRRTTDASGR